MKLRLFAALIAGVPVMTAQAAVPVPDARTLAGRLHAFGAKATVDDLDKHGQLDGVLDRIGKGSTRWVALAPALAPGTDAASAEGLGVELARALPSNPVAVLEAVNPGDNVVIGIRKVCGIPFIEPTEAFIAAYRRRAIAAVSKVRIPSLEAKKQQCLAQLRL